MEQQELTVGPHRFSEPAKEVLAKLDAIAAGDKPAENRSKTFGCTAAGAAVLTIVGFILVGSFGPAALLLPALTIALFVVFLRKAIAANRRNFDDGKVALCRRFVRMISADVPAAAPVDLAVDFRTYRKGGKRLESNRTGRVTKSRWSHGWLTASVPLADGSSFVLSRVDRVDRKEKSKRKTTIVRERHRTRILLTLRAKASWWGSVEAAVPILQRMPPPAGLTVRRVAARGGRLVAILESVAVPAVPEMLSPEEGNAAADALLGTLAWAFAGLSRTATKAA